MRLKIKDDVKSSRTTGIVRNQPIYSGVGYRARALAYSVGCFREALLLRPLFVC